MTEQEQQVMDAAIRRSHDVKTRRVRMIGIAALVIGVVSFAISGWIVVASILTSANKGADLATQVTTECSKGVLKGAICEQAEDTEKAVEDAPAVAAVQGPRGFTGRPATAAETLAAVAIWCRSGRCEPPGPTQRQVNMAVSALCGTGDRCRGEDGVVTQAQVDLAVVALCGEGAERCRGEDGEDMTQAQADAAMVSYCQAREDKCVRTGETGNTGAAGRGVKSVDCSQGTGTFTFTFTDDTTQTVECTPPPEPTPDPVPSN